MRKSYTDSGNRSHYAKPVCVGYSQFFPVKTLKHTGQLSAADDYISVQHIKDWGAEQDTLVLEKLSVPTTGNYDISVQYNNSHNAINLGITNGVKQVRVYRLDESEPFAEGIIQLPHVLPEGDKKPLRYSVPVRVPLEADSDYRNLMCDFKLKAYSQTA